MCLIFDQDSHWIDHRVDHKRNWATASDDNVLGCDSQGDSAGLVVDWLCRVSTKPRSTLPWQHLCPQVIDSLNGIEVEVSSQKRLDGMLPDRYYHHFDVYQMQSQNILLLRQEI